MAYINMKGAGTAKYTVNFYSWVSRLRPLHGKTPQTPEPKSEDRISFDPPARAGHTSLGFRHVGRLLHCATGQKFAEIQPLSQVGSDEPAFAQQFANIFLRGVNNILKKQTVKPGPGTLEPLFQFLWPESAITCRKLLLQGANVAVNINGEGSVIGDLLRGKMNDHSSWPPNARP